MKYEFVGMCKQQYPTLLDLGVAEKAVDPKCGHFDRDNYNCITSGFFSAIFYPPPFPETNGLLTIQFPADLKASCFDRPISPNFLVAGHDH